MNKIIKKVVSLSAALVMMSSATIGAGAIAYPTQGAYKDRTCKTTIGTVSGTVTYTNYYQTAVNSDSHTYKTDGYVEIHKGPSNNCYRSITAKLISYCSGQIEEDDTAFKTHINGDGKTRMYCNGTMAITLKAVDYYGGDKLEYLKRTTKDSAHEFSKTIGVTRENSTDKTRVYCTLEGIYNGGTYVTVTTPSYVL